MRSQAQLYLKPLPLAKVEWETDGDCAKVTLMPMLLRTISGAALAISILNPQPAYPECAPGSASFCQKLPDRASQNSAVFLGIVTQVVTPVRADPPAAAPRPAGLTAPARRRAGDPTPRAEMKYPAARFQVLESFLGPAPAEFEVRLTSDHFVDGIPQQTPPFAEGEIWLVEAYRDLRDQQWTTSSCQRTKPAARAEEDLRVLRAWAGGQTLPAHVDGELFNRAEGRYVAGVEIYLRGATQAFSTTTDNHGHFAFENLTPGIYEASATLPQAGSPIKIDLTTAWCSHVVFAVK